jgi:protein-S-isoprenylcysteine O-methyltransferase Ste14
VTLACYEPFNRVISGKILRYDTGHYWFDWFGNIPALAIPWALVILLSFATWLWATSCYGIRWSNLTNRGIITNGPYRFTKHPDYVSKSIFFWLINVPFLSAGGPMVALQTSLLLVGINAIYFGRARTEERHLSEDPAYVAYALAMNERSVFRGLARILPVLRYKAR